MSHQGTSRGAAGLTRKQIALMTLLERSARTERVMPTLQEMADGMGITSKGTIHRLLEGLAQRGYIERGGYGISRGARDIKILKPLGAAKAKLIEEIVQEFRDMLVAPDLPAVLRGILERRL